MSTDAAEIPIDSAGVPELTALGKRIELLRIERRMSKRVLAQRAGTSRQQLWRVMTGKSELTSSLCARLAEVLEVDSRSLRGAHLAVDAAGDGAPTHAEHAHGPTARPHLLACHGAAGAFPAGTLEEYLEWPASLERTVDTLPAGHDGRPLKRALLNAIEDAAERRGLELPVSFFDLRRKVVNGER